MVQMFWKGEKLSIYYNYIFSQVLMRNDSYFLILTVLPLLCVCLTVTYRFTDSLPNRKHLYCIPLMKFKLQ